MILSAYRRDDFADPTGYVVQAGRVLENYSDAIIREATEPSTGIQSLCRFPPSIKELSDMLKELTDRAVRIAELGRHKLQPSTPRPPRQNFWSVLVHADAPQYQRLVDRAATGKEDPREWMMDPKGRGIWVSFKWLDGQPKPKSWREVSAEVAEKMREHYPPAEDDLTF
jgi:hypothetical protein